MKENNMILNRFFTQSIFSNLLNEKSNTVYTTCVQRYVNIDSTNEFDNGKLISEIYHFLNKEYRNEYFYKNTMLNKLLLGKHSLKTTTALTEIPINKSKADFILINGKAVVYEIKTELDTFDRLETQLSDYYKAFDHVSVVTSESNYLKIQEVLKNTNVGICILTNRNTISTRKAPIMDKSKLSYDTIFKILRKNEYENIIMDFFGELPKTTQFNYYKECFNLFQKISLDEVYKSLLAALKKRTTVQIEEYNKIVPYELKFLIYFSKFSKNDYNKLEYFLNKNWRN